MTDTPREDITFVLRGIGGSTAHGLANEFSDEDSVGVFGWPTRRFWNLSAPAATITQTDPDASYHEVAKFLSLASKSNPTVLEVLWLESYDEMEPRWGEYLVDIRAAFASRDYVHNAYLGYADAQFRRLQDRGTSFSSNTKNRVHKHAKHMFRLLEQGQHLYETGELRVRVADPDAYRAISEMTIEQLHDEFAARYGEFVSATPGLPEKPDYGLINTFLADYREAH